MRGRAGSAIVLPVLDPSGVVTSRGVGSCGHRARRWDGTTVSTACHGERRVGAASRNARRSSNRPNLGLEPAVVGSNSGRSSHPSVSRFTKTKVGNRVFAMNWRRVLDPSGCALPLNGGGWWWSLYVPAWIFCWVFARRLGLPGGLSPQPELWRRDQPVCEASPDETSNACP